MVKCKDCGLVMVREKESTSCMELDDFTRGTGHATDLISRKGHYVPRCLVLAHDLASEFLPEGAQSNEAQKIFLKVLTDDRECGSFTPWLPGFTPKEHVQMVNDRALREEIEQRRRNDEAARIIAAENNEAARLLAAKNEECRRNRDWNWSVGQMIVQVILAAILAAILAVIVEPWKERAKQSVQPAPTAETVPLR